MLRRTGFVPLSLLVPLLVVLVSLVDWAVGAEKQPGELQIKTERVIVFKDGYALLAKSGSGTTDKQGEAYTDDVPDAAVLGSFWAVPAEGRLVSMLAGWEMTKESNEKDMRCTQPIEILAANQGKQAKVELHDKTLYSGVIHEVLIEKAETPLAIPQLQALDLLAAAKPLHARGATPVALKRKALAAAVPTGEHTLTTITGANFVLRTDEGDVLLPVAQVRSIVVKDMKTTISKTLTSTERKKRLTFKFEGAEKKQSLSLMYFRPGIRWIPTYRVALSEKKGKQTAAVSLQAELLNEAEDLDDVPIDIVVGVPNFRFRDTPSPLVLEAALRNALAEAAPHLMGNASNSLSNAMYSQRSSEFRRNQAQANDAAQGEVVKLPGELTASGAQDLFVYNLPKLTLGKSERCAVPIFTAEVPYGDVYTWDVRVTKHDNAAAPSGSASQSPLTLSKNEVWHQILLTNNTNLPWTTGAAMILQGQQPLAQELLTYTPPKDEVRVPVTVAVDVRGSLEEKEVDRTLQALKWDGYNYARIEREMKLDLCNNKPIAIEAEITLRVGGKVTKASHEGSVVLNPFDAADWVQYHGHPAVNNSSSVTWKAKLKPGESIQPTIVYHYHTRH